MRLATIVVFSKQKSFLKILATQAVLNKVLKFREQHSVYFYKVLATVRETGCGLGYGGIKSIDMTSQTSKAIFWRKAQERYEATDVLNSTKTYSNENSGKRKNEEIDMFAETVDV